MRIDPRDNLVAQIAMITACGWRIDELASPQGGPTIDPDQNTGRSLLSGKQFVGLERPNLQACTTKLLDILDHRVAMLGAAR